ncbi:hypothetical protein ACJX0J_038495 [Zea mays]
MPIIYNLQAHMYTTHQFSPTKSRLIQKDELHRHKRYDVMSIRILTVNMILPKMDATRAYITCPIIYHPTTSYLHYFFNLFSFSCYIEMNISGKEHLYNINKHYISEHDYTSTK